MKTTIIAALVSLCLCASMSAADPVKSVWVGDKYFELVPWTGTWDAAKADAESKGGRLACIKDAEINTGVCSIIKEAELSSFIGGYKSGDKWLWIDGTEVTFKNWSKGMPDNNKGKGVEDCMSYNARLFHSKWNDIGKASGNVQSQKNKCRPGFYILELTREQYNARNTQNIALPAPMPGIKPTPVTTSTQTGPGHI